MLWLRIYCLVQKKLPRKEMSSPVEILPKNGGVPLKYFLTEGMLPDRQTVTQLEHLAHAPGLNHHIAVLPDVHRKSRNFTPTGTVVVSKDFVIPRAVDKGINCGMRMITTDIDVRDMTSSVLDNLFNTFMKTIPVDRHDHDILTKKDVEGILVNGGKWSKEAFDLTDEELDCIENRATMPTDSTNADAILSTISEKTIKKGQRRFCTLGGGNHFLELQEIVEVFEPSIAKLLGLTKGKVFFMLHTGSRSLGSKTMKAFFQEFEQKISNENQNGFPIWSLKASSDDGVRFTRAVSAASNFGFANRIAITEELRKAVRITLNDWSLQMPLLYDCAHVSIQKEQWSGEELWVHRHGASRALPPSQFSEESVFSKTGQPVPIPGSMAHDSFVGVADEKAYEAFYSVNHGAGRVLDKPEAQAAFSEEQVQQELASKKIRLYQYGTDNIAEQAPRSFKDISEVMRAVSTFSLAKPVVRLRPVAVLKG